MLRMGVFVGMQVLVFMRTYHDRPSLDLDFFNSGTDNSFFKATEVPSRQPGRQEGRTVRVEWL
jgi:hypothetical protein